jgi:hypothetical protein
VQNLPIECALLLYSELEYTPVSRKAMRLQPGGVSWAVELSSEDVEGGDDATDTKS